MEPKNRGYVQMIFLSIQYFSEFLSSTSQFSGVLFPKFSWLVVSIHLKDISQNGNLPQFSGWKYKNIWVATTQFRCHSCPSLPNFLAVDHLTRSRRWLRICCCWRHFTVQAWGNLDLAAGRNPGWRVGLVTVPVISMEVHGVKKNYKRS